MLICERLIPYSQADFSGLDPEEIAYRLALAIAIASKRGFRLKDCGRGNWGFGLRNGRIVPLLLSSTAIAGQDWIPVMTSSANGHPKNSSAASGHYFQKSMNTPRRRSIKRYTIHRMSPSLTPTTSAIFYCGVSRG